MTGALEPVVMSDTPVQDGALPELRVGDVHALPLALHRRPSVFAPPATPSGPAPPTLRDVSGTVAFLHRHARGGTLVLQDAGGAGYVVHLRQDDPPVAAGQHLVLHAEVTVDPYAWYTDTDADDLVDQFAVPWRIQRLQCRVAPLIELPDEPGTWTADRRRAQVSDVDAVERWHPAGGLDVSVDYVLWLVREPR
jgi:hypothetical protein